MEKTQVDPRIGAVLGNRYRITSLLGEGGMGLVYRGERLQLGRPVAIKFLHSPYARSPKFVARFEREARAMSKLSHPHCVSVIDFGVQDAPYIVMDFVTGSTLRDVLDAGPVPVQRSLSIVRQVLFGLAHAHSEGVIHRDIKPGNVMLGELTGMGDHVRIFDFGLAKLHDAETDGDASTAAIVGTPAYMAPEQARADKIDKRVDLYATGVLLFELLTGQKPFIGADAYSVLMMQRDKAPPKLRELAPQLSQELEEVVARALEKEVDKRFQDAAEFVAALEQVPEASGRPSSIERDLPSTDTIAYAKTQHQLKAPSVDGAEISASATETERASHGSLAGTSSAQEIKPRKSGKWLWMVLVLASVGLSALLVLRGKPSDRDKPKSTAASEKVAPANAPAEPVAAEPTRAEPELPAEPSAALAEPDASAVVVPEPPTDVAERSAEPDVDSDAGSAADELSEAALAAADEALNEESEPEVKVTSSAPPSVQTVAGARTLIRQNKLDEAIEVIRDLRKKTPKNAELPFMLGDLYFDRGWWSDGLAKYREAIRVQSGYKQRASLQRNAIRALADDRTYARARALLVKDVGRAAAVRLRKAAKADASRTVRKRASSVLAQLSR